MTKIRLFIDKSIEQNASIYFEKAKKLKKKIEGAKEAIEKTRKDIEKINLKKNKDKPNLKIITRKKEWYEKFRWTFTSGKKLVIGGRDATTNDIIIKKQLNENDIVFHADIAGSPFCIVKEGKNNTNDQELEEVAQFTAANSKAFKLNITNIDVYWVNPDQISMEAPSGEYLSKGAFMIYGKKNIINSEVKISIGIMEDGKVMAGNLSAIKANTSHHLNIKPGNDKKSDIAKKIQKYFSNKTNKLVNLDEIMQALPPGDAMIDKLE